MARVYSVSTTRPGEFGLVRWFSSKLKSFDFACSLVSEYSVGYISVCSFPLNVDPEPSLLIDLTEEFRTYLLTNRIHINA